MKALAEKLKATAKDTNATDIRAAFAADPNRFSTFSTTLDDLLFDYSKCAVNEDVLAGLEALAAEAGVEAKRDAMFSGEAAPCCTRRCATGRTRRCSSMART